MIMVGEIRDEETAHIANKAALTGHLVLSTLHTNDAASTVTRLMDMGIESYLLSTTLLGVMAQRLVRLNCPHCTTEEIVDPKIAKYLKLKEGQRFFRGAGCYRCHYSGYHGRNTVIELLSVTPAISEMIVHGRPAYEIAEKAMEEGMTRLQENALKLAVTGRTSVEEVYSLYVE